MTHGKLSTARNPREFGQRMIFTGPDGIGDYRPRSSYFPWHIGESTMSPGGTSDLNYLYRAAPHTPHPLPKQSYVGGIGWGLSYNQLLNSRTLLSNMQIKRTECRAVLEDRVTYKLQNPWRAPPRSLDKQPAEAPGRLTKTQYRQKQTLPPIKRRTTCKAALQPVPNNVQRE